ncbi:hypothetical protein KGEDBEEJ_01664 [Aeromonas hydrophila]
MLPFDTDHQDDDSLKIAKVFNFLLSDLTVDRR